MKIYTKTGDKGKTSLYDGSRVYKNELIFDVLGEIDELSSRIGMLCSICNEKYILLRQIQSILQDVNSIIATIDKLGKRIPEFSNKYTIQLENEIDEMERENSKLTKFILPGVTQTDAQAQLCRTQTRKVERFLWKLHNSTMELDTTTVTIDEDIMKYMNRLSDFFFVFGRWICYIHNMEDVYYTP